MIHSGTLSYLNGVHRRYGGIFKYRMVVLKRWSDGKLTVKFEKVQDENPD